MIESQVLTTFNLSQLCFLETTPVLSPMYGAMNISKLTPLPTDQTHDLKILLSGIDSVS